MSQPDYSTIETRRLRLEPVPTADPAELTAAIANYDVVRWLGRVPWPYGVEDAEEFIEKSIGCEGSRWVIRFQGRIIGGMAAEHELGYWIAREAWGQGFVTEAAWAALDAYFANPEADSIPSSHLADNQRSATVLKRLGFRYTGDTVPIVSAALSQTIQGPKMELTRADWAATKSLVLKTDRLILRPHVPEDAKTVARFAGTDDVAPMIFLAKVPWPESEVRDFLSRWQWRGHLGFRMAVCELDGRVIGSIGISREPKIFYFYDRDVWGKGYAVEAARTFLTEIFRRFDLPEVGADVFHDNPASSRVLEKLGFQKTGDAMGTSAARLEPFPVSVYRLTPQAFEATR